MVYRGKIQNGVVVLEGPPLPEGTIVQVEPVKAAKQTLGRSLMDLAGIAPNLPPDMAKNHDHYIHGRPKK